MTNGAMQELYEIAQWTTASKIRQDEIVDILLSRLNGFEVADVKTFILEDPIRIISFRELATGIVFNLIPGGTLNMGFSEAEAQALRELQLQLLSEGDSEAENLSSLLSHKNEWHPVHLVNIAPFLLSRFPLRWLEAERLGCLDEDNSAYQWYLEGESFPNGEVAELSEEELEILLENPKYLLPSESQWEYACRAGSTTLFFWGNNLMFPWVEDFSDPVANDSASNRFGLVNMGFHGDICADTWHDNYQEAPVDGSPWINSSSQRVLRGGAAFSYPWQGCNEWVTTISAYREAVCDFINVRLTYTLPL